MGDPCGIGPEVVIKAVNALSGHDIRNIFLIGDLKLAIQNARKFSLKYAVTPIREIKDFSKNSLNVMSLSDIDPLSIRHGKPDRDITEASLVYIDHAIKLSNEGIIGGFVTGPVNKNAISKIVPGFTGHTEYIAKKSNVNLPVMLMVSGNLKVIPLTTHIPLNRVTKAISSELISSTLSILDEDLSMYFDLKKPNIAVTGLNPHGGQDNFGLEENEKISPAIKSSRTKGINASGPYPADSIYSKTLRGDFDAVLAMYHDQALIPVKAMGLNKVVNVTLGLPFVRTSPGHGTAYDIAGKGIADQRSMLNAVKLALKMTRVRSATLR